MSRFMVLLLPLLLGPLLVQRLAAQEVEIDSSSMTAIVAIGESIAEENCGRCHALGQTDASPHKEAPPFRVVVKRYRLEDLAESLAEGIVTGHPDMPVVAIKEDEIDAFLTYLGSLLPD
ncbi:MAG: cytochrome c [Alphaproteobacteria bacterium]|nr:cytochrome c [Alphaproteobacteria bacterium]